MKVSTRIAASFVSVAAAIVVSGMASAVVIPNVKATATSFDTLGFEGFGVFGGGNQLVPGSFGNFGGAVIGSVRDEFVRGPWKMVDRSGLIPSPSQPGKFYHTGNLFAPVNGVFQQAWLSLDGPNNGSKTFDIYPSIAVKEFVVPGLAPVGDGVRYTFGPDVLPVLTFDLGNLYNLTSFNIWNWCEADADAQGNITNDGTVRGVRDVIIEGSVDGVIYSPIRAARIPKANPLQVTTNNYLGAELTLTAENVRFLQFTVTNSWAGDLANTNVPAGVAEIEFNGTVVPEPAAMSLLAVPALALMRRRRA